MAGATAQKIGSIACGLLLVTAAAHAEPGMPQGLTTPQIFPPYRADSPACAAPQGLARRLVFAQDNARDFMQGAGRGLALAAKQRGLDYTIAFADNDAARMAAQLGEALATKTGAVIVAPVNSDVTSAPLKQLIASGAYVGAIVPPPAVTLLNAPQYLTGKVLAKAAAAYIDDHFGGKANVVLLTHDSLQFLAPRFAAMRDVLQDMHGVTIIADISPVTVDRQGGRATMNTILTAQERIDVVLGADTVVLGALDALRAAGQARDDQFLGGIDGEPEALAEIRKTGPYKTTVSLASPVFAYALGQFAADWMEGKSVPQAMDILPSALDAKNLAGYEADIAEPDKVFADPARRARYLNMFGNICFDTRDSYVSFPWSSEAK